MSSPEVLVGPEIKIPNPLDHIKRIVGRLGLAISLSFGTGAMVSAIEVSPAAAEIATGGYPDASMPCLAAGDNYGKTTGPGYWCAGYDWGDLKSGNDISPRGYVYRNCTDWAAFRAKELTGVAVPWGWGNANTWDEYAKDAQFIVDQTPEIGDIAQSNSGNYGHVGTVEKTNKDPSGNTISIEVSQYNENLDGNYSSTLYSKNSNGIFGDWDNFIDLNGTGIEVGSEGSEVTDGNYVYTQVGGSLWPIKGKNEWTASDTQYWGNDPRKITTDEVHAHEVGYDANGPSNAAHPPIDGTAVKLDQGSDTVYYFVGGNAYPLGSTSEMADLNITEVGQIPQTFNRLNQFLGRTLNLPNGAMYRYAASDGRINQILQLPTRKTFWVPSTPMLECIQQVKKQRLFVLPKSSKPYLENNTQMTDDPAGCTFPLDWTLSTPGGSQQFRVEGDGAYTAYSKRLYSRLLDVYLNSPGGQPNHHSVASLPNIADGSNMAAPDNVFFRNVANGEVFWWHASQAHKVPSTDALSCMGGPQLIPVPPEAFQGGIPLGSQATCSFEGKLIHDTSDGRIWEILNSQKHYVLNTAIMNGLEGRVASTQHRLTDASHNLVTSYNTGADAFVPYGPPVFMKYSNNSDVWLVLRNGTRRHAMSICSGSKILVPPTGEMDGHVKGANWSANSTDCNKIANGQDI